MASSSTEDEPTPVGLVRQLVEFMDNEEYTSAMEQCKTILADERLTEVHAAIQKTMQVVYLRDNNSNTVNSTSKSSTGEQRHPYALYRAKRYTDAAAQSTHPYVRAQALYHAQDPDAALEAYAAMLDETSSAAESDGNTTLREQILTNALAVAAASTVPYSVVSDDTKETESSRDMLVRIATELVEEHESNIDTSNEMECLKDYPYDLAYNLATLQLLEHYQPSAILRLDRAARAVVAQNDPQENDDEGNEKNEAKLNAIVEAERGPIITNRRVLEALYKVTSSPVVEEKDTDVVDKALVTPGVRTVRDVNRETFGSKKTTGTKPLTSGKTPPESFTSRLQQIIWSHNRAIQCLHAHQYAECRTHCRTLQQSGSPGWEVRAAVIQAQCSQREQNGKKQSKNSAESEKKSASASFKASDDSNVAALLYRKLHAGQDANEDPLSTLESLPTSLQRKPGVLATKAAWTEIVAAKKGASTDITSTVEKLFDNTAQYADYCMSQGRFKQAAELYERALGETGIDTNSKENLTARWVYALSHVDPAKAVSLWSGLGIPDDQSLLLDSRGEAFNAPQLELQELPRTKTSTLSNARPLQDSGRSKKKSRAAVLRSRAKKAEQYVASLTDGNVSSTKAPDPERWLPKYERKAYARRNRNHHKNNGAHQGSGMGGHSAAQLDVVARREGRGASNEKSTAHMTVAGGSRKGKRR